MINENFFDILNYNLFLKWKFGLFQPCVCVYVLFFHPSIDVVMIIFHNWIAIHNLNKKIINIFLINQCFAWWSSFIINIGRAVKIYIFFSSGETSFNFCFYSFFIEIIEWNVSMLIACCCCCCPMFLLLLLFSMTSSLRRMQILFFFITIIIISKI